MNKFITASIALAAMAMLAGCGCPRDCKDGSCAKPAASCGETCDMACCKDAKAAGKTCGKCATAAAPAPAAK